MTVNFTVFIRFAINALLRRPPGTGLSTAPEDYGLSVTDHQCRERARGVFKSFFTGVESAFRSKRSCSDRALQFPPLYQPFFWEGTAMGQSAARQSC